MKKLLTIFLFILATSFMVAQQPNVCNFVPTASMLSTTNYSNRNNTIVDNGEKYVFNVKFHTVFGSLGENPDNINEEDFLAIIAQMNIRYNQYQIFFKYSGFNDISDNSFLVTYNNANFQLLKNKFVQDGLYDANAINIFVPNSWCASRFYTSDISDLMIKKNAITVLVNRNIFFHDLNHRFGLLDIHQGTFGNTKLFDNLPSCIASTSTPASPSYIYKPVGIDFSTNSENVTRDPLSPNYNAHLAGDHVEDTGACFASIYSNFCPNINGSTPNFIPTFNPDSRVKDNLGIMYDNVDALHYNVMSTNWTNWSNVPNTQVNFTAGQVTRMRETIANDADGIYTQRLNLLPNGTANVYPLYEPFQRSTTITGILSTYDNGNGTARVCRGYVDSGFRFQPGFDYEFPDDYDEPTTFTAYNTSVTPLVNPVFNCPVRVLQVSNNLL
jgi:hypothetical protein